MSGRRCHFRCWRRRAARARDVERTRRQTARALISGVKLFRIMLAVSMGTVLEPGPARTLLMTYSSRETPKESRAAPAMEGQR